MCTWVLKGEIRNLRLVPVLIQNLQPVKVFYWELICLLIFEAFAASISPIPLRAANQELIVSD